ncbi:MAG: DEAD/DEAH box helicase [Hyphomonadaceae bacterium]
MTHFEGVAPTLGEALSNRGYETLTPVQTAMIDPDLAGKDLLVSAQTGSGKTVAFGIAAAADMLDEEGRFDRADLPFMLVIAPTRELALQVKRELEWLYAKAGARIASCVGGMDMRDERRALNQGAHIVVGTPGRLVDHVNRGSLNMDDLKIVTLDEADEMLDMGFRDELQTILDAAPEDRRTLMFSATVSRSIANLAKTYQNNAVRVNTVAEKSQHTDIDYRAITVAHGDKENALVNILRYYDAKNAIVFCATRAAVNRIHARMNNRGFSAVALSGEFSQKERSHALQAMRDGRAKVCIATDVAARGIDLPDLELVIHADLPKNREGLLHRSGRTGRAGRKGTSALIVGPSDRRRTERLLQNAKIDADWVKPPSADDVRNKDNERLLENPIFSEPVREEDKAFAAALLERYGAEQIAGAIVRIKREEKSAPEELGEVRDQRPSRDRGERRERNPRDRGDRRDERPRKPRDDFQGGEWFSLSVGRNQTAEARWLLPMLCKAGGLDKSAIGAIRVHPNVTFVELAPASTEGFVKAIGKDMMLEKSISVTKIDGVPEVLADDGDSGRPPRKRPSGPRQPRRPGGRKPDGRSFDRSDRPHGKKPYGKSGKPRDHDRPSREDRPDRSERSARPERSERSDRSERPDHHDRSDRPRNAGGKPFKRKGPKSGGSGGGTFTGPKRSGGPDRSGSKPPAGKKSSSMKSRLRKKSQNK